MQSVIKLNFIDVNEYRKAVGREVLKRLSINFSDKSLQFLEIGPGMHSELVEALRAHGNAGENSVFIEPHLQAGESLKTKLSQSKVIGSKLEEQVAAFPFAYFDFIYANFSLHWSDKLPDVLKGLSEALKSSGCMGFTITDHDRSFWALVNQAFKKIHPGSDLFHASETKNLDSVGWKELLLSSGFRVKEQLLFSGTASTAPSAQAALDGFKKAVGDKYLKLNGITKEAAESWILSELSHYANTEGKIQIPASGLSFICEK